MRKSLLILAVVAAIAVATAPTVAQQQQAQPTATVELPVVKQAPALFTLPYREVKILDDGSCPQGRAKLIVGGDGKNIPRFVSDCLPMGSK